MVVNQRAEGKDNVNSDFIRNLWIQVLGVNDHTGRVNFDRE